MADPLSEVVRFLRPRAVFSNVISGSGNWAVRYSELGLPSFCIVLEGHSLLRVDGHEQITISAGDFVLLPTTPAFTISSFEPAPPVYFDPRDMVGRKNELRYGTQAGAADMRSLGGSFEFDCVNPGMLASLLPPLIHVRGSARLTQLVQMVGEESASERPGSEFVLSRLTEMLLIEAMRSTTASATQPGLLRGLSDDRLARALKEMHANVAHRWSVIQLAQLATLSRSAFFERFTTAVGVSPMEYLLQWRMELAKELLSRGTVAVSEIAERVGYGSPSAFSVAFSRHVGQPPRKYAQTSQQHDDG